MRSTRLPLPGLPALPHLPGLPGVPCLIVCLGLITPSGCGLRAPAQAGPSATLSRYLQAIERDDPQAAYHLLDEATQRHLPYPAFAAAWQDTGPERRAQAQALAARSARSGRSAAGPGAAGAPMTVQATVSLGGGSLGPAERGGRSTAEPPLIDSTRMLLVREDHDGRPGPFRLLDFGAGDVRPQTPEEALRLLLLAAEQRSYAAVMRLLSPAQRRVVEAELNERIDRLRAALSRNQPIEVRGERARFQYDPRFYIDLQKDPDSEGAAWRVLDLN